MRRSNGHARGVDAGLLIKDAAKLLPDPSRRLFLRNTASLGAPRPADRLRHCRRTVLGAGAARRVAVQRLGAGAPVQSATVWPRPIPRARSRARFRSTPIMLKSRRPTSMRIAISSSSMAWSKTRSPGRWSSFTRCRRRRRSRGSSASRVGARSASGPARRCGEFLRRIGADLTAKYVHFVCAEGYSVSIDMPTALHAQTQMTFKFDDEILPTKFGFPMRIRMPTKLGFKNPKHVVGLAVLNNYTGGYWEDRGYNWFSDSDCRELSNFRIFTSKSDIRRTSNYTVCDDAVRPAADHASRPPIQVSTTRLVAGIGCRREQRNPRRVDTEPTSRHAMDRLVSAGRVGGHGLLDRDRLARVHHAAVGKPALDRQCGCCDSGSSGPQGLSDDSAKERRRAARLAAG